jgi:hypothetical protein
MTEVERLIQYVKDHVSIGWGSIYEASFPKTQEKEQDNN